MTSAMREAGMSENTCVLVFVLISCASVMDDGASVSLDVHRLLS